MNNLYFPYTEQFNSSEKLTSTVTTPSNDVYFRLHQHRHQCLLSPVSWVETTPRELNYYGVIYFELICGDVFMTCTNTGPFPILSNYFLCLHKILYTHRFLTELVKFSVIKVS